MSMEGGSSAPKPPPGMMGGGDKVAQTGNGITGGKIKVFAAGEMPASGRNPGSRAFEPPQDAKLVRSEVLLKKEKLYPFAWKPHKVVAMVFACDLCKGDSGRYVNIMK